MKRISIFLFIFCLSSVLTFSQDEPFILSQEEIDDMMNAFKKDTLLAEWFSNDPVGVYEKFKINTWIADSLFRHNQEHLKPLSDLGFTRHFELLPLIDWFTNDDSLINEAAVAYLIRTDNTTVLFDVGLNRDDSDPSPLLKNIKKLGVNLEEIDVIVISHPHGDHIGGGKWREKDTFSLTSNQIDLGRKQVFTPIPMTYPGLQPIHTPQPTKIADGVTTIGVITCPLFNGIVQEQALAIHLENKGIIVISGCGHQTIEKILERTEILFNTPVYGLLGGFHLPISVGRNITRHYQYYLTSRLPWLPLIATDISNTITLLKKKGIQVVGISGHDSCDSSITMFREAFGDSYIDIVVGDKIILN